MSWINAAIAVGSAVYGAYQSNKQAKAATKAGKDPLAKERKQLAGDAMGLLDDPSSFFGNPLYQAAFGQGTQAVMRGMASQGYAGSGNMAAGLQQYGQSFGWGQFMEYEKMLSTMAGFGDFQSRAQGLQGYSDARGGMQDAFGQLGTIFSTYGGGSSQGTPAGGSGSIYNVGGGYGSTPFGQGSWDQLNIGKP